MRFLVVIPARLESKRLPNKVVLDIKGKSMLQRVIERCKECKKISSVILCTDNEILKKIGNDSKIKVILTSKECQSGSERIASVIDILVNEAWGRINSNLTFKELSFRLKNTYIINVQADQPLIDSKIIDDLVRLISKNENKFQIVTPIYKLNSENIHNPDVVKTLVTHDKRAIYFSRAAIPYIRDIKPNEWHKHYDYWGHAGIYCFRADILKNWFRLPKSKLEKVEKLEQLNLIDYGYTIDTFIIEKPTISIDNITQLEEVRKLIRDNE